MKGPVTTNSYGIVHHQNNKKNIHIKKKLTAEAAHRSTRDSYKLKSLHSLASKRADAFKWLQSSVTMKIATELPLIRCPICHKIAFLCRTPTGAIAWSDTKQPRWVFHLCAVDLNFSNTKLTDAELSMTKNLTESYKKLRAEIDVKKPKPIKKLKKKSSKDSLR